MYNDGIRRMMDDRFRKSCGRYFCRPSWLKSRRPCRTSSAPMTFTCPSGLCCERSDRLWAVPAGLGHCRKWERSRPACSGVATSSSSRTALSLWQLSSWHMTLILQRSKQQSFEFWMLINYLFEFDTVTDIGHLCMLNRYFIVGF